MEAIVTTPDNIELIEVTADSVEKDGFFCFMSKKKSEGYQRKLVWLRDRFEEGLRIRMYAKPERGFIEYSPGEFTWRAIHADGYMVIHCLWVVGKSKGKGLGKALVERCIEDARDSGMKGVAVLTSEKVWMVSRKLFVAMGFERVEEAEPAFTLLVKRFSDDSPPYLAGGWKEKAKSLGNGLTMLHSPQCPYIPDAIAIARDAAADSGIPFRAVELNSRADVIEKCPNPYGVFGLVLNGVPLSYHFLLSKELIPQLKTGRTGS